MDIPETRYAKTVDGAHIAFQAFGHGEIPGHWTLFAVADDVST